MGDINGSIMYTEPRMQWTKRGLGSQAKDAEADDELVLFKLVLCICKG
jgi:hypothetical protein